MYYLQEKVDYIFCYVVLQHTSNPQETLHKLGEYAKKNARLSIDVYTKIRQPNPYYGPKYFWHPVTKRMNKRKLLEILQWYIPKYIDFHTKLLEYNWKNLLKGSEIPVGWYISGIIPIPCWNYLDKDFREKREYSTQLWILLMRYRLNTTDLVLSKNLRHGQIWRSIRYIV